MENIHNRQISQANWDYLARNPQAIKKTVGIVYAGRSGSIMLSSLLDGHSHLLSFNYYCDGPLYLRLKELSFKGAVSVRAFQTYLSENLPLIMSSFYEHPLLVPKIKQCRLNHDLLMSEVAHICDRLPNQDSINIDLMLAIIFIAYGKINNRPLSTISPIMIIQIHTPFLLDDWRYIFNHLSNFHLLVTVRNPLKAIDSHFFHHTYEILSPPWKDFYQRIMLEYKKSFLPFLDSEMALRAACIAFEDLHENLDNTMRALCQYIGIPFEVILLQETLASQPVTFISSGRAIRGHSVARARDKTLKMMRKSDQAFIEYLFKEIILALKYKLTSNLFRRTLSRYWVTNLERLYFKKSMLELEAKNSDKNELKFIDILLELFALHKQTAEMKVVKNKVPIKINKIRPTTT